MHCVFLFLFWLHLAGRPFAMELLNPHKSRLNRVEMKQLQEVLVVSIHSFRISFIAVLQGDFMYIKNTWATHLLWIFSLQVESRYLDLEQLSSISIFIVYINVVNLVVFRVTFNVRLFSKTWDDHVGIKTTYFTPIRKIYLYYLWRRSVLFCSVYTCTEQQVCKKWILSVLHDFCFVFRPLISLLTKSEWETCRLLPGEWIWNCKIILN